MPLKLENSWKKLLDEEFQKSYFSEIRDFLKSEIESGKTIYPHPKNIFAAFNITPVENVKVVILWQDPYHGEWQAMGLSFSVPDGIKIPPSLRNIYKEIESEWYTLQNRSPWIQGELSEWNEDWGVTTQSPLIK